METFGQDLRYGARLLIQRPVFTLMALLTLAVGVGANTAIFSVVNALLIRPLPYSDPGQLVVVFSSTPQSRRNWVSYHDLQDWRAQAQSFSEMTAFAPQSVNLTGIDEPALLCKPHRPDDIRGRSARAGVGRRRRLLYTGPPSHESRSDSRAQVRIGFKTVAAD